MPRDPNTEPLPFQWVKYQDTLYNLETMSREALLALRMRVEGTLGEIRSQLEAARVAVRVHGVYADSAWYAKAEGARRYYSQAAQRINTMLGKKRREASLRAPQGRGFADAFYAVAKEVLPAAVVASLRDEARQRVAGADQEVDDVPG